MQYSGLKFSMLALLPWQVRPALDHCPHIAGSWVLNLYRSQCWWYGPCIGGNCFPIRIVSWRSLRIRITLAVPVTRHEAAFPWDRRTLGETAPWCSVPLAHLSLLHFGQGQRGLFPGLNFALIFKCPIPGGVCAPHTAPWLCPQVLQAPLSWNGCAAEIPGLFLWVAHLFSWFPAMHLWKDTGREHCEPECPHPRRRFRSGTWTLDPLCQVVLHALLFWKTMETVQCLAKLPKYWLCSANTGSRKPQQPDHGDAGKLAS